MAHKADMEIAHEARKKPIQEIGAQLVVPTERLLPFWHDKAKASEEFIKSLEGRKTGHLVRVTAVNPRPVDEIMIMPGLPRVPAAESVHINEAGLIDGLF